MATIAAPASIDRLQTTTSLVTLASASVVTARSPSCGHTTFAQCHASATATASSTFVFFSAPPSPTTARGPSCTPSPLFAQMEEGRSHFCFDLTPTAPYCRLAVTTTVVILICQGRLSIASPPGVRRALIWMTTSSRILLFEVHRSPSLPCIIRPVAWLPWVLYPLGKVATFCLWEHRECLV